MKKLLLLFVAFFLFQLTTFAQEGWFWQNPLPQGNALRDIYVFDENTAIAVGNAGTVIKTTDSGTSWNIQHYAGGTTSNLFSVHFTDNDTGWVVGYYGNILKTITGGVVSVELTTAAPADFVLQQNYPNPFNPTTTISFSLTAKDAKNAKIEIYNLKGQKVKTLISDQLPAGEHSVVWDGKDENNKPLSSGIYFYKLKAGNQEETRKMILLK